MGRTGDSLEERRPELRRQFLGIIETVEAPQLKENDRGGDDRAGKWSAAGLIDARNKNAAPPLQSAFVPE